MRPGARVGVMDRKVEAWQSADELRYLPGWVRYRLAAWLDEDGQALQSRSQRTTAAAVRQRAEQQARREQWAARAAASGVALVDEVMSRPQALAPPPIPVDRADPSAEYRAMRAELERQRLAREAEMIAALGVRRGT